MNNDPFGGTATVDKPTYVKNSATERQLAFIATLAAERAQVVNIDGLTKSDASVVIDALMKMPKTSVSTILAEEFFVRNDNTIAKVQRAIYGSGNLYAKELNVETGKFEYSSGLIRSIKSPLWEKLTLERARSLGHLYGRCMVCGRTLTDEKSIAAGIGPICAGRF